MSEPHVWTPENLPSIVTIPRFVERYRNLKILNPANEATITPCCDVPNKGSLESGGAKLNYLSIPHRGAIRTHVHPDEWKQYILTPAGSTQRGICRLCIAVYQGEWKVFMLTPTNPVVQVPMNAPHAIVDTQGAMSSYRILVSKWGPGTRPTVWEKADEVSLRRWRPEGTKPGKV